MLKFIFCFLVAISIVLVSSVDTNAEQYKKHDNLFYEVLEAKKRGVKVRWRDRYSLYEEVLTSGSFDAEVVATRFKNNYDECVDFMDSPLPFAFMVGHVATRQKKIPVYRRAVAVLKHLGHHHDLMRATVMQAVAFENNAELSANLMIDAAHVFCRPQDSTLWGSVLGNSKSIEKTTKSLLDLCAGAYENTFSASAWANLCEDGDQLSRLDSSIDLAMRTGSDKYISGLSSHLVLHNEEFAQNSPLPSEKSKHALNVTLHLFKVGISEPLFLVHRDFYISNFLTDIDADRMYESICQITLHFSDSLGDRSKVRHRVSKNALIDALRPDSSAKWRYYPSLHTWVVRFGRKSVSATNTEVGKFLGELYASEEPRSWLWLQEQFGRPINEKGGKHPVVVLRKNRRDWTFLYQSEHKAISGMFALYYKYGGSAIDRMDWALMNHDRYSYLRFTLNMAAVSSCPNPVKDEYFWLCAHSIVETLHDCRLLDAQIKRLDTKAQRDARRFEKAQLVQMKTKELLELITLTGLSLSTLSASHFLDINRLDIVEMIDDLHSKKNANSKELGGKPVWHRTGELHHWLSQSITSLVEAGQLKALKAYYAIVNGSDDKKLTKFKDDMFFVEEIDQLIISDKSGVNALEDLVLNPDKKKWKWEPTLHVWFYKK